MFSRLRLPPWLRLLLAFGLVPVVVFVNPQTAAAANPWHTITIQPELPGQSDSMDCTLNLQHNADGTGLSLGSQSVCSGGTDISPGVSQWGEEGSSWAVSVSGTDETGASCGGNGSGTFGAADGGVFGVAGTFGAATLALGSTPSGCNVTEVCVFLFPGGNMTDTQKCQDVDIPSNVDPTASDCVYGQPVQVTTELMSRVKAGTTNRWEVQWFIVVHFGDAQAPGSYDNWLVYGDKNPLQSSIGITQYGGLAFGQNMLETASPPGSETYNTLVDNRKPKEVQVYAADPRWNTLNGNSWDSAAGPTFATTVSPPIPEGAYRGLTQPAYCRYWFGPQKIFDPDSTVDDPAGGVQDDYVPPPPADEPTIDPVQVEPEPVDSENGFWTLVGGLLRLILGAIRAVGTAIANLVGLILDGIKGLFVPDAGFMDSEFRDLEDEWQATTPARFVDSLEGFQGGAVSGCGGLPLELPLPGGIQVSESIGAACSGKMADVAAIVRMVLSAGLVVGGTFACVRALGSGFGWNPGIGTRADV